MGRAARTSPAKTSPPNQRKNKRLSSQLGKVEDKPAKTCKTVQAAKVQSINESRCDSNPSRHELASSALKPGLPKGTLLPCRDKEREKISKHLRNGVVQGGSSEVLYISGMPGTGKTAMVLEVMEQMQTSRMNFQLVHINAMKLSTPVQVFREISDQLPGGPVSNNQARNHVDNFFYSRSVTDPVIILLIDEIDCLKTANQAILYKVFDWLDLPGSRLVLASISNTMDLPERLLPRVASRFHIERVDFEPYSRDQIYEILQRRLQIVGALDVFGDVVLRLCAARVAAKSGDVRKALQVCRRAIQVCVNEPSVEPGPVKLSHFQVAEKELLFANPMTQAILETSTKTRHFLAAVVLEFRLKEDGESIPLQVVISRFQKVLAMIAVGDGETGQIDACARLDIEDMVQHFLRRLEAMGVFAKRSGSQVASTSLEMVSLGNLDLEDLSIALLEKEEHPAIREVLEACSPDCTPSKKIASID